MATLEAAAAPEVARRVEVVAAEQTLFDSVRWMMFRNGFVSFVSALTFGSACTGRVRVCCCDRVIENIKRCLRRVCSSGQRRRASYLSSQTLKHKAATATLCEIFFEI
jgi:hypothetical protein